VKQGWSAQPTILCESEEFLDEANLGKEGRPFADRLYTDSGFGLFAMVSELRGGFQLSIGCLNMLFRGCGMSAQFVLVGVLGFVGLVPRLNQMLLGFSKMGVRTRIDIFNWFLGTEHSSTK
jgi:hypothetical protein